MTLIRFQGGNSIAYFRPPKDGRRVGRRVRRPFGRIFERLFRLPFNREWKEWPKSSPKSSPKVNLEMLYVKTSIRPMMKECMNAEEEKGKRSTATIAFQLATI